VCKKDYSNEILSNGGSGYIQLTDLLNIACPDKCIMETKLEDNNFIVTCILMTKEIE